MFRHVYIQFSVSFFTILTILQPTAAQDAELSSTAGQDDLTSAIYSDIAQFGGPSSVGGQLAEDNNVKADEFRWQGMQDNFAPWFQSKQQLSDDWGLQFGINETILYQTATSSPTTSNGGAAGVFEVLGQWDLFGRETDHPGSLVFKAEDRHRIGEVTPFDLGFAAGSILPTGTKFNDFHFSVTNLFWKQYFFDRQLVIAAGRIDPTDFVDVYALMNPLTHFTNLAFSTNPAIAAPNQGLGAAAGAMLTEKLYLQGGFSDANGQSTQAGFDTFFDDNEYFSYIEAGVTSSQDRIYLDNVHVTFWHTDARVAAGTPDGWGVAFSAEKYVCDKWLPFFRFGYSDGDAALMQTSTSTGIGLRRENNDVAGIGFNWGKPADGSLSDQFTSEVFYRFQLTQFLAVTPDVQLIVDPALNPGKDVIALFGLRLRTSF